MSTFEDTTLTPAIGLSEEQAQLLDIATDFCRDKSPIDRVRALLEDERGFSPDIWQEMVDLGWLTINLPEEYGGVGLGLGAVVPIAEQMGRRLMAGPYISTILASEALLYGAAEAQKQAILPEIATGAVATLALCEDHADWNLAHLTCTATKTAKGLALAGVKYLVSHAEDAEYIIISLEFEGAPALVIARRADFDAKVLRREKVIDETRRAYALKLDGVVLPLAALLPPENARACLAHIELAASLLFAAEMCGGTHSTIDYTIDYLKTRKQFGKPIGSYQSLKHVVVDAHLAYEKLRSHLYSAAFLFGTQGEGEIATRMAKAEANSAFAFAADRAIQFHGGFGFTYDCDAQLYRRRAMWCEALYGSTSYHRRKLADLMF